MLSAAAGDRLVLTGDSEDLFRIDVTGTAMDHVIIRTVGATSSLL